MSDHEMGPECVGGKGDADLLVEDRKSEGYIEEGKSEDPPTRRERSPIAIPFISPSSSSAILEWDPSADGGDGGREPIGQDGKSEDCKGEEKSEDKPTQRERQPTTITLPSTSSSSAVELDPSAERGKKEGEPLGRGGKCESGKEEDKSEDKPTQQDRQPTTIPLTSSSSTVLVFGPSAPPTRRGRPPTTIPLTSPSSAVLEWDPSADVGAMCPSSEKSSCESKDTLARQISECCKLFQVEPNYEVEGGQPIISSRSTSGSSSSQKSRTCAYSTPRGSPVPLAFLHISPVPVQTSTSEGINVTQSKPALNLQKNDVRRNRKVTPPANSSEDNNNGDTTEGKRTPGRVSDASTDWEYDHDKQLASKSMSQWQTSGLTRSELEYQNKKNSGSSTSMASSVFLLKVESNVNMQEKETPPPNSKGLGTSRENFPGASSSNLNDQKDLERKIQKALNRRHTSEMYQTQDVGSSDTDPSSMCVIVDQFVKLLENNPTKENIKFDVLKNHRDYHLMKVWKQISKLEKLNMNLLACKQVPKGHSKSRKRENKNEITKREEVPKYSSESSEIRQVFRTKPTEFREVVSTEVPPQILVKPASNLKVRPTDYSSEPLSSSRNFISKRDIGINVNCFIEEDAGVQVGGSCPVLKESGNKPKKVSKPAAQSKGVLQDELIRTIASFVSGEISALGSSSEVPQERVVQRKQKSRQKPIPKPKAPIGFFVPLSGSENEDVENEEDVLNGNKVDSANQGRVPKLPRKKREDGLYNLGETKPIQDWFMQNNPVCYKNIQERDNFLINIKRDRRIHNETLFREIVDSSMTQEEVWQYLQRYFKRALPEERNRLQAYWDLYLQAQAFKQRHANDDHVIALREMKERTARLIRNDPVALERQRKEAEERRKRNSRMLQKDFSTNLRRFQRMGNVNVPDRLKLSTR